jgi:hypothetical protein
MHGKIALTDLINVIFNKFKVKLRRMYNYLEEEKKDLIYQCFSTFLITWAT